MENVEENEENGKEKEENKEKWKDENGKCKGGKGLKKMEDFLFCFVFHF